ncbi:hypothetical protein Ac2012v2_000382 [Leucoagaricus gongylophorus]
MWRDVHRVPALRSHAEANPLLPQPGHENLEVPNDTIFEVFINKYTVIIIRAENMVVQQVCTEVETQLKAHFYTCDLSYTQCPSHTHTHSGSPDPNTSKDFLVSEVPLISQTLLAPLSLLSTYLSYLLSTFSLTTFTALYRRISTNLSEHILHRQILFRGTFNATEGRVILAECELFLETCNAALAGGLPGGKVRVEAPWSKLLQAGRLVALEGDLWDEVVNSTFDASDQEEWEEIMHTVTGHSDLSRETVGNILRRRNDCRT